ncbi:DUF3526 domain-containing protein [Lysobacter antibioticus]|uniref:DUF3526 domain-containing protein n=1 Tax=Lysobacter antibioticus TaxID=84531 RepID=UPI00034D7079|nr:DUF3526 domain-containing protein [Lysobacter antibioticus]
MSALPTTAASDAAPVNFAHLLRWELRQLGRSRLLRTLLALLGAAMLWGAHNGAALHHAQDAAIERSRASDAAWAAQIRERARRYAEPAAERVPYWQDPTDIAGFSRYFLRVHADKPHLPLSPLAVGASDLLPSRLPVKLETPFGIEPAYDFENPRGLALGRFDLGFVLAQLLPIAAILLVGLLATFERDHGMLRLIAAQRVSARVWLGARIAAIYLWLAPAVLALTAAALAAAGVEAGAAWRELAAAAVLLLAYVAFWVALGGVVAAAWPNAAGAIATLAALWALLAVGVPMLGSAAAERAWPAPSAVAYVDAQRRHNDAIAAQRDRIVAAQLCRNGRVDAAERAAGLDYATRLSFLAPELERRLAPLQRQRERARDGRERVSVVAGYLSPTLGLQEALARLAGTDAQRHRAFEAQVRVYQQRLRDWFYPRIQRRIGAASADGTYGRLNFAEYDDIPAWHGGERSGAQRAAMAWPFALWLWALSGIGIALAWRRLRDWPTEL